MASITVTGNGINPDTNLGANIGESDKYFSNGYINYVYGTAMYSNWADLAEKYLPDEEYEFGTIIQFGGEKEITIATTRAQGVISSKPGYVLNSDSSGLPVALSGRVPVKVICPIKKGDRLTLSNIAGVGMKQTDDAKPSFAVALEENASYGIQLVNCVVRLEL